MKYTFLFLPAKTRSFLLGIAGFLITGASAYGQLVYSDTSDPSAQFASNNPSYDAPQTLVTTGTTTTATAIGTTTGTYPGGDGYSFSGNVSGSQDLEPTSLVANISLSATASALTPNGAGATDFGAASAGQTDFSVATTGVYTITSEITYNGTTPGEGGALFYTFDVAQIGGSQNHIAELVSNDNEEYTTPGTFASESESFTLVAGDLYGIDYGATVNPTAFNDTSETLDADGTFAITAAAPVPEPLAALLLMLGVGAMGVWRRSSWGAGLLNLRAGGRTAAFA